MLLDGISMVGTAMFNVQINNRLKDIKGNGKDFGGISIIVIGDLFQLKPVMNGYVFKDIDNSEYGVLAPNLWHQYFKSFELQEIMRPRESKTFAEILIRLREGKQTEQEILTFRQREVEDIPHLFIENSQVDAFNDKVYNSAPGIKFTFQASVIGASSDKLREKIL